MKPTKLLTGIFAAALAAPVHGATFEITGATAFRRATIESLHALFNAGGSFRFGSNKADDEWRNADNVIFEGTITGIPGTTIVRATFNGSIEGLRAIAESPAANPEFYKASVLSITAAPGGAQQDGNGAATGIGAIPTTGNLEFAESEIAFSDTDKAISPYASNPMVGGPVGVAVFGLVATEDSPITNVTYQQYNSLLSNGIIRLSAFTGLAADDSKLVFCTGRNDGSGTRSSYLAEMGYGVANPVKQYLVVGSDGNFITALQEVPAGGVNPTPAQVGGGVVFADLDIATFDSNPTLAGTQLIAQDSRNKSIVWGNDVNGNGGARSGSGLVASLGLRGDRVGGVRVFDAEGFDLFGVSKNNVSAVSWISLNDAVSSRAVGAQIVAFNGVKLDVNADQTGAVVVGGTFMSEADKQKCYRGAYSPWNFQQMYYRFGSSADTVTLHTALKGSIPTNLGSAGLKQTDFKVGRANDGGTMNPLGSL